MKVIQVGDKKIELDIGDELRVKDLRKIYPLLKKHEGNEIEMVTEIVKSLAVGDVTEIIDDMTLAEFTNLSEQVTPLLDTQKKTGK